MRLSYQEFLSFFNPTLAKEKSCVVDLSDIDDDQKTNFQKRGYCTVVIEEGKDNPLIKDEQIIERMQAILDTVKEGYCKTITKSIGFDFNSYEIPEKVMALLNEAIITENFPDGLDIDFDMISEKALLNFLTGLATSEKIPNRMYLSFRKSQPSEKIIEKLAPEIQQWSSKEVYLRFATLSSSTLTAFSTGIFKSDLSKKKCLTLTFNQIQGDIKAFTQGLNALTLKTAPEKIKLNFTGLDDKAAECLSISIQKHYESLSASLREYHKSLPVTAFPRQAFLPKMFLSTDELKVTGKGFKSLIRLVEHIEDFELDIDMQKDATTDRASIHAVNELLATGQCRSNVSFGYPGRGFNDGDMASLIKALQSKGAPVGLTLIIMYAEISEIGAKNLIEFLASSERPAYFTIDIIDIADEFKESIDFLTRRNHINDTARALALLCRIFSPYKSHQPAMINLIASYLLPKAEERTAYKHVFANLQKVSNGDFFKSKDSDAERKKIPVSYQSAPSTSSQ